MKHITIQGTKDAPLSTHMNFQCLLRYHRSFPSLLLPRIPLSFCLFALITHFFELSNLNLEFCGPESYLLVYDKRHRQSVLLTSPIRGGSDVPSIASSTASQNSLKSSAPDTSSSDLSTSSSTPFPFLIYRWILRSKP